MFAPLEDPLSTDFGVHRWLHGAREEAYSDWLAWVLGGLGAAEVFAIFEVEIGQSKDWSTAEICREYQIKQGRLDIVLRWQSTALLVITLAEGECGLRERQV